MFNIDDYVIYGLHGVCTITDIVRDENDNNKYYVIKPQNSNYTIKTHVDNHNIFLRSILNKEEVMSLIESMPNIDTIWISDSKQRFMKYRALMKSGKCEDLIKVIKTLYQLERNKVTYTDNEILKGAKKMLHEEFAIALKIPSDQVEDFILKQV